MAITFVILKNESGIVGAMLSIIIPALDEAKTIGKTVSDLLRRDGDFEIIVVDGGSQDGTRKIVEQLGVTMIKSERGITEQLAAGISAASGDRFLFLHADCQLPQDAIKDILALEGQSAGAFLHQYDNFHLLSALQASINNVNAKLFGRFSGEQGFFCTREALMAAGGLSENLVFETEDLAARMRLAGVGLEVLPGRVVSSNRRFSKQGLAAFVGVNWAHAAQPFSSQYKLKKYFGKIR